MVLKFRAYMPESMVVFLKWNSSRTAGIGKLSCLKYAECKFSKGYLH